MNKKLLFLTVLLFLVTPLCAQSRPQQVYFFATNTSTPDDPTIKLTENLFYTQFQSENLQVTDYRPQFLTDFTQGFIDIPNIDDTAILFGLELQKEDKGWICRMNLLRKGEDNPVCYENTYESYYKILMDAKNLIGQVLAHHSDDVRSGSDGETTEPAQVLTGLSMTLDTLAGTWKGESLIDKIIILRSGRGFVIFNNGASMNIAITLKGNTLEAVQTGKPNASFFPDLPREVALAEATRAEPVAWSLSLRDADTLSGTKTTLLPSEDDSSNAERRSVSVIWKRL